MLRAPTSTMLRNFAAGAKLVFIDEAQRIEGIGTVIKLFTDNIPDTQVIATGSSSFVLADKTAEPLTGRKYEFLLLPLLFNELVAETNVIEEKRNTEQRLIFGSYPEIVTNPADARELVRLLATSYLYRDIHMLDTINNAGLFERILKALALQIGSEVSYNELSRLLGADKNTIEKYLWVLEQAFVIFKLPSFGGNMRTEIRKGKKYYFYDNGIRNAAIGNFNPIATRTDVGALWENYVVSERVKRNIAAGSEAISYFWRTTQQQEIDYIEELNGKLYAYEIKWSPGAKHKFPQTFSANYETVEMKFINRANIEEFLL
jgi:predicted AAA+ superfamily ATPase